MVAVTNANLRPTLLVGGAAGFKASLEPKLRRYGLNIIGHFDEGHPPERLPNGYEVYLVLWDVTRDATRNMVRWKLQCQNEKKWLIITSRKESAWVADFERAGIQRLAPVAAAALNEEQAGELKPMAIVVTEKKAQTHASPTPAQRKEQLLVLLEDTINELRKDHGLGELLMGSDGVISATFIVRETVTRGG